MAIRFQRENLTDIVCKLPLEFEIKWSKVEW